MAEEHKAGAGAVAPEPARQEEDALFKMQVGASEFLIRNARWFGYVAGAILLGALVYGVYTEWKTSRAQEDFAAIAAIDFKMPKVDQMAQLGLAPMDDPSDTARLADVAEGARRYRAAAQDAHGTAAVFGYLRAAETWKRVSKPDEALTDLQAAHALGLTDLPGFAAANAYATALAGAGRQDEAIAVLRDHAVRESGLFAEESLIALAQLQVGAGKVDDAKAVVTEFQTRFPESPRIARIAAILPAGAVPAPAAPSVPAPATPAPTDAPAAPAPGGAP